MLPPNEIPESQRPQDGQHPQVSPVPVFAISVADGDILLGLAEPVRLLLNL